MSKYSTSLGFVDLLFNLLLAFVCLFVLSFILINPNNQSGKVDPKAEFLIVLTWEDDRRDDIDLWVEDPEGNIVSFTKREAGLMHLDRDARGARQGGVSSGAVGQDVNQEIVTIRGFTVGEYVVNTHGFFVTNPPVKTTVQVLKLNPYGIVCERSYNVDRDGQEDTACRFTVDNSGHVTNTNEIPKSLFGDY